MDQDLPRATDEPRATDPPELEECGALFSRVDLLARRRRGIAPPRRPTGGAS